MRDFQLDAYRGIIMIYIVCLTHVVYWLDILQSPKISLMLFEMPVIFFIGGASMQFARAKSQWRLFESRFNRVLVPYVLFAVFAMLVFVVFGGARGTDFYVEKYGWSEWCDVLLLKSLPGVPFAWQVWFVLPYFLIAISFNVQKKLLEKIPLTVYLLILTAAVIVFDHIYHSYFDSYLIWLVQEFFFYDIFFIIGYKAYNKAWTKRRYLLVALSVVCFAGYCLKYGIPDIQVHKFPPSEVFLLYCLMMLGLQSLIFSKVTIPPCRIIDFWNKRGYNIFLYQSFVYFVYWYFILDKMRLVLGNGVLLLVVSSCFIFGASMAVSMITYPLENRVQGMLRGKFS